MDVMHLCQTHSQLDEARGPGEVGLLAVSRARVRSQWVAAVSISSLL
jgi:hypothetical protein